MKKQIISSLAIIGLALIIQGCAVYAQPYGQIGFYGGRGPYYGFSLGYWPYSYYSYRPFGYRWYGYRPYGYRPYGYRPYYRGYKPYSYYRYGPRNYGWGSRYNRYNWGGRGGFSGRGRR